VLFGGYPCGARFPNPKNRLKLMRLISLLVCVSFTALAQTPAPDVQTLQSLLAEVHQLRIALERSTQIAPRIQIAVERLKMQQEQVGRVAKDVDDARRELDHFRTEQSRIQQRVQSIGNAVTETADPDKRKDLNNALDISKQEADQAEKSVQQAQVREGELTSQLQSDQAKLTELNDRLNQIERALSTPENK
jgi:predicted  nucleic acid-binding Zn-ribbon protein